MHEVFQRAARFEALPAPGEHAAPYAFETIFDASSWRSRQRSKEKFKLLKRIDGKLRRLLHEGEKVRYVTTGIGGSFLESYFLGWAMYFLNRRAIVLTDRRVLLLQVDARSRPGRLISQIRYAAIEAVGRTLSGSTKLTLGDGRTHAFGGVPKKDREVLRRLTDWAGRSLERATAGLEDLCPHCHAVVEGRPPRCGACDGRFKSARRAGLLSLLFPGLGDLYMGHRAFAAFEILAGLLIWLGVLLPGEAGPLPLGAILIAGAVIVVLLHGSDAVATWYVARKGVYPAAG